MDLHWATCRWLCTCCRSYPAVGHGGLASRTPEPEEDYHKKKKKKKTEFKEDLLSNMSMWYIYISCLYVWILKNRVFVPCGLTLLSHSLSRSGWAPEIRIRTNIKFMKYILCNLVIKDKKQSSIFYYCVSWILYSPDSVHHVWIAALPPPLWGWWCSCAPRRQRGKRQRWSSLWCRPGPLHSSPPWPEPHSDSWGSNQVKMSISQPHSLCSGFVLANMWLALLEQNKRKGKDVCKCFYSSYLIL